MQNITPDKIIEEIEELIGIVDIDEEYEIIETSGFTPRTKRVIENAFREAKKLEVNI